LADWPIGFEKLANPIAGPSSCQMREADMAKLATRDVELEPIDRLEEKVKLLVAMVDRMKGDQARADEENSRLSRDLEAMHERVLAAEATTVELTALRSERDAIRTRVSDMLDQLEGLSL
jgi:outer membrane murein-binding lipoprotein Lpp